MSDQLNGAQLPAATFEIRCGQFITSSRDAIPDLFGGYGRIAQWMSEFKIDVREKHHLDTVGVQALVIDQPSRKHLRLRWVVRLDVDPTLEALEAMAV